MMPFPRLHAVPTTLARGTAILICGVALLAHGLGAQVREWNPRSGLRVGSEEESYLRVLQVAGLAPLYPWTIRGFAAEEVPRLLPADTTGHPWKERFVATPARSDLLAWGWVRPQARAILNSTYPFGENDGAVWAGRGLTGVVSGGVWLQWGPLHVRVAPEAFLAQNAGFALADNGMQGDGALRDSRFPAAIDLPQRFGTRPYARLVPGSSEAALTLRGITLGVSTAAQVWGPSERYPLLLGDNAGGFAHAFLQSSAPVPIGIGRLQARLFVGRPADSEWSPLSKVPKRMASGLVLVMEPRGLPGLELGFERFVHSPWPSGSFGVRDLLRPFTRGSSTSSASNPGTENQLAGAFVRWSLPAAGFEMFVEFIRDDFPRDFRDIIVRPDDLSGRTIGARKVVRLDGDHRLLVLRGESVTGAFPHSERDNRYRVSPKAYPLYIHLAGERQGHTNRGQLLGSPAAYGGSGWTLGADLYDARGRTSLELFGEERGDWLAGTPDGSGAPDRIYGVGLGVLRFYDGWDLQASVRPSFDLNRNVVQGNDVFNLNLIVGMRGLPW